MVVLLIGNNDAIDEKEAQHVSLSEYRSNIISILERLHDLKPSVTVLLVTTTRINEQMKPLQKNQRRAQYADVLRSIHRGRHQPSVVGGRLPQNMCLVDLWGSAGHSGLSEERRLHLDKVSIYPQDLHDGSHLDVSGNKKLFCAIKEVINSQLPHLSPDNARPAEIRRKSALHNVGSLAADLPGASRKQPSTSTAGTGTDKVPAAAKAAGQQVTSAAPRPVASSVPLPLPLPIPSNPTASVSVSGPTAFPSSSATPRSPRAGTHKLPAATPAPPSSSTTTPRSSEQHVRKQPQEQRQKQPEQPRPHTQTHSRPWQRSTRSTRRDTSKTYPSNSTSTSTTPTRHNHSHNSSRPAGKQRLLLNNHYHSSSSSSTKSTHCSGLCPAGAACCEHKTFYRFFNFI